MKGNPAMKKYTIAFGSVTTAIKAQSVLAKNSISTEVVRTPKNLSSGCGYSLVGYGDILRATEILDRHRLVYKSVMEG